MYRFIRWYNQNRMEFFIILIVIAFILIFIQVLNGIAEEQQKKANVSLRNSSITEKDTTISKTNESVITGETITQKDDINNVNIIKQFVDYCNKQDIANAYEMLTDECKEVLYPTIMDFEINYYNKIFYMERLYSLENWFSESNVYT